MTRKKSDIKIWFLRVGGGLQKGFAEVWLAFNWGVGDRS